MTIDRTNYEVFFLDYLEGRLTAAEAQAVEAFAAAHPDLRDELDAMRAMSHLLTVPLPGTLDILEEKSSLYQRDWNGEDNILPLEHVPFTEKASLKKPLVASEEEELLLAAHAEGDSDTATVTKAQQLLHSKPWLAADYEMLQRMRVTPEPIVFMHKAGLRRDTGRVVPLMRYFSYAAAAAVVAWLVAIAMPGEPADADLAAGFKSRLREMTRSAAPSGEAGAKENTLEPAGLPRRDTPPPVVAPDYSPAPAPQDLAVQPVRPEEKAPDQQEQPQQAEQPSPLPENHLLPGEEQIAVTDSSQMPGTPQHSRRVEQYQSLFDFAQTKAKNKLWGGRDYPEDNFALALAQREVQRRFNRPDSFIEVTQTKTPKERELKVRVGKFEFSRKR
jgi:hypothetical protein